MRLAVAVAAGAACVSASMASLDELTAIPKTRVGDPAGPSPPQMTEPPSFGAMELLRERAVGDRTCGYFINSGSWDWFTCANDAAICTNSGNVRQCCHSDECSSTTFGSVCMDYFDCPSSSENLGTYCCTYSLDFPFCSSYLYSTTPGEVFTFYGCGGASTSRIQLLFASTEDEPEDATTLIPSSVTKDDLPSPPRTQPSSGTSRPTDDPEGSTDGGRNGDDGGGSAPLGAIVGGVVGGVAVLALLALAIVILVRKSRRNNQPSPPPMQPPMMQPGHAQSPPPPPHGGPGMPPAYPPSSHQSMMGLTNGQFSSYNPHHSMYSNMSMPTSPSMSHTGPVGTFGSNVSPLQAYGWPGGASPPQGMGPLPTPSPPMPVAGAVPHPDSKQGYAPQPFGQGPEGNKDENSVGVTELGTINPVGHYNGNNRAELG